MSNSITEMNRAKRFIARCLFLTCIALVPTFALAQAQSTSAGGAASIEEIVVTARKRDESALDVPVSLSVFDEATLERSYVKGLVDLQNSVPGLFFQERGGFQTYASIRGVGGDARNIGLENGVSVAIDGVSTGRTSSFNFDLAEIAQVEVLRGPQGTLFGTNTIGGIINVITKKPTDETEFATNVSFGNHSTVRATSALSGALSDTFFAGVSVSSWNSRGYIDNTTTGVSVQGQNKLGGRVQLRWAPNDQLEVNFSADKTRSRRQETLSQCVEPFIGPCAAEPPPNRFVITAEARNFNKGDFEGVNGTIDFDMGRFSLKSISAYRKNETDLASDGDATSDFVTASGPFEETLEQFTQEFRLVSPDDNPFRFVAGLFYSNKDVSQYRYIPLRSLTNIIEYGGDIETSTYAGYLNADLDVSDILTLNAGVRYNNESKDGSTFQSRVGRPELTYNFDDLEREDTDTSWTGSAKIKFTSDISSYVTVSRGFKSGGFQADLLGSAGLTSDDITFGPEAVTNYELGLKSILLDQRLSLNIAVFRLDYEDRQVLQFIDPGMGALPFTTITNAGESRTDGIEIDATMLLPSDWSLSLALSHLDAKYIDFRNANSAGDDYSGNFTETTPRYTGYVGVDKVAEVGEGRLIFHADASYNGDTYFSPTNNPQNFQDGYWLFNGRLGYERDLNAGGGTFGVFAFVKNAAEEDFFLFKRQGLGANQGVYGNPRFYGLQFIYRN